MKKFLTFILMIVLVITALANLGPMVGLVITLAILYFAFKQFLKSTSILGKLFWGIVGLFALAAGLGNFSAIIGILAIGLLYVVYKDWKKQKAEEELSSNDPFTNFERQWEQMKKY